MDVSGKRVFLSGPMSGHPNLNVGAFVEAHAMLKEAGAAEVYDPAVEYLTQTGTADEHDHAWYMTQCIGELVRHAQARVTAGIGFDPINRKPYDLLVSLPGWWDSEGACTERSVAEACGIECVDLAEVVAWV